MDIRDFGSSLLDNLIKGNDFGIHTALTGIVNALTEYDPSYKFVPGIHPHEFSCGRRCYYSYHGYDRKVLSDPRAFVGKALHKAINMTLERALNRPEEKWIYKADYLINHLEICKTFEIRGEADGVFLIEGKPVAGMEIKTAGTIPSEPLPDHELQVGLYQYCLDVPYYFIFYINRDCTKKAVFMLKLKDRKRMIENRLVDMYFKIKSEVKPEKEKEFMRCSRCPYKETCDAED
uniref:Dna2/Cas4 domain-containing protein n=1 Tax=Dictyoglomus turgidum TaxID=513050 RepID=A0A7C3WR64_9BACT